MIICNSQATDYEPLSIDLGSWITDLWYLII